MVKRLFDVLCAAVALVISAPLIGIAAIGIKLTDPGPVFFRARRVGYLGREFTMFKLRTMRQTTEGVNGPLITGRRDPRVYPLGQLLRRMKIDELPQLFNVLRGDMAIVGPRRDGSPKVQATTGNGGGTAVACGRPYMITPPQLRVREATPEELANWDGIVRRFPNHRVPHLRAWIDALAASNCGTPLYLLLEDDAGIVGALPG